MIARTASSLLLLTALVLSAGNRSTYRTQNGWDSLDIESSGRITFAADDSDVTGMSSDGYFRFEQSSGGTTRKFVVVPHANGELERNYFVNGLRKTFDAEAKAWLARTLPEYIRESGINAPERVQRILRQQGAAGVLAEIQKVRSDGSRRIYLEELLRSSNLKTEDQREAMRLARRIGSDGEKAALLVAVSSQSRNAAVRDDYFDAVASLNSDGEHRRVLTHLIENYGIDKDIIVRSLRSAKAIHSDGEKARVLIEVSKRAMSDDVRQAYFRTADSMHSDGERRRVLSAAIKGDGYSKETLARALRSAALLSSDGEKAGILVEAAAYYSEDAAIRKAYFDAADTIHSGGERRRVLSTLLRRTGIGLATLRETAKSAARIQSDGEKGAVLTELAQGAIKDAGLRDDYFAAVSSIHSAGVRSQVLIAALDRAQLEKAGAIQLVACARGITSDGEKARVLSRVAEKYSSDREVTAAVKSAAESISSDGEYRRVMSHLTRRASF